MVNKPRKVKVPTRFGSIIENILNRFRTFQVIELDEFSDDWFALEMHKVNPRGTICEAHRQIYNNAKKLPESREKREIMLNAKKAYIFGQKMDNRLKEYNVYMNDCE